MNDHTMHSWLRKIFTPGVPGNQTGSFQNEAFLRSLLKESKKQRQEINSLLKEIPFAILDTETTGFHPDSGDQIISVAIAKLKNGIIVDEYSTFINPKRHIPYYVTELTNINEHHVKDAPLLVEVIDKILQFINGSVVIGYHIHHDLTFINHFLWKQGKLRLTQQTLEIRQIIEALHKQTFETLDDALKFYKITCEHRHDASADVLAMKELWNAIANDLEKQHIKSLYDLYAFIK